MITLLRHAVRSLRKSPGFTVTTVLTLALGLGATTAIFSVLYAVLLRPFAYPDADRLVLIWQKGPQMEMSISWPTAQDWMRDQETFEALSIYRRDRFNLSDPDRLAENVTGAYASASLFQAAKLPALQGRYYTAEEDRPGAEPVVVISESLWARRFHRNPAILGQTIPIDGVQRTVVGVAPAAFTFPRLTDVWVPIAPYAATQKSWQSRGNNPGLYSFARLKPGVTINQAQADLERIYEAARQESPWLKDVTARFQSFRENQTASHRTGLWALLGATLFVLVIACANVASLFITRGIRQERDYAVRSALGATRMQLVKQMLAESTLVALLGGVIAVAFAEASLGVIRTIVPQNSLRFQGIELNFWVLGFALVVALVSGVLAGLWPALKISRTDVRAALHEGSRGSTAGSGVRRILVGAQVALTLVLLSVSGLILRSLERMQSAPLGFDASDTLTFSVSLPGSRYATPDDGDPRTSPTVRFFQRLADELRDLPGVMHAAISATPPLNAGWQSTFAVEGIHSLGSPENPLAEMNMVTDDYFATLRIPLLIGRAFNAQDATGPRVCIIDLAFAEKYWPGEDPLGKRINWGGSEDSWFTVVGVVPTVRVYGYSEPVARPQAYWSMRQNAWLQQTALVRTQGNPRLLERSIRELFAKLDPDISIYNVGTMEEQVARTYQNTTLQSRLLTGFAVLAFVLALTGLYGVVAYGVTMRRREIGVRMALGAERHSVIALMLRQGLVPLALGTLVGLAGTFLAARAISSQLYEVSPFEPWTPLVAALLLGSAAALATWLPARRAARVNPVEALRAD